MSRRRSTRTRTVETDTIGALLADTLAELRAQLAVVEERRRELKAGHFDPDLAAAAASLARAVSQTVAQSRLQERHDHQFHSEPKTKEEREARIRSDFEELSRPTQVEVARSLVQIAGDGTLLGR